MRVNVFSRRIMNRINENLYYTEKIHFHSIRKNHSQEILENDVFFLDYHQNFQGNRVKK